MKTRIILGAALAGVCGVVILFAQQRPAGPYTADQVASGRAAFQTNCASCHAANLSGAEGPELALFLEIPREDGSKRKVPVSQLLLDIKTGKPLGKSVKFHFTGSELVKPDPNKPDTQYAADASGTLIAIFPVTAKTVLQSTLSMKDEKFVKLETDKKILPKEGTPVKLIIEVVK